MTHPTSPLALKVRDPIITGSTLEYVNTSILETYQHEKSADIGFVKMSTTFTVRLGEITDWLERGLGRDVTIYNMGGNIVWEGFVNTISVAFGGLTVKIGPLVDIANRVTATYTPIIDATQDPPIKGTATETTIAENAVSQGKYGIWEKVISVGEVLEDPIVGTNDAEEIRDTYLADHKDPSIESNLTFGGKSSEPKLTIECEGYYRWFEAYVYNYESIISTQAYLKIGNVIDADPNGLFSSANSDLGANVILVPETEDENRMANDIIEGIVSAGDQYGNRWLFGVGVDRRPYYKQMPDDVIVYTHAVVSDPKNIRVFGTQGTIADPWDIEAGVWMILPDIGDIASPPTTDFRADRRMLFIESVQFSYPDNLTISGSRVNRVDQKLKRLGLGGML